MHDQRAKVKGNCFDVNFVHGNMQNCRLMTVEMLPICHTHSYDSSGAGDLNVRNRFESLNVCCLKNIVNSCLSVHLSR